MAADRFDLAVVGAGSAGIATAIRAATHGARVALLDPAELGGTCVNLGCVPKKAMWLAADLSLAQRTASELCFNGSERSLDWPRFIERREAYIANIHASYRTRLDTLDVRVIRARARLQAPGTLACVGEGPGRIDATHIVLATGGVSRRAPIPGGELGIDSDGFFGLQSPPRELLLVGGGYIAVELAGILSALGTRVRLLVRGERLLSGFDTELSDAAAAHLAEVGVDIRFGVEVTAVSRERGCYRVQLSTGGCLDGVDEVLWAVGREPNTHGLGLDALSLATNEEGRIEVDPDGRTSQAGIYALGDVAALGPQLTPLAVRAGRALADQLFGGAARAPLLPALVPTVVFGRPPLGSIGLSEDEARDRHGDAVRVYRSRFRPMLSALAGREHRTLMKLVCAGSDERIVGLHVAGAGADEMLQGFAVAMSMGATKADFDATVAIHPTSAEELVLL